MQLDNFQIFDTATVITNTSVASANILDLAAARDLGPGEGIKGIVLNNTTFGPSTNTGTVNIQVQVSTSTSGTWSTILESGALGTSALNVSGGRIWDFTLAKNNQGLNGQRYLRINYSSTPVNAFTTGSVGAYLLNEPEKNVYYPSGFTVTN